MMREAAMMLALAEERVANNPAKMRTAAPTRPNMRSAATVRGVVIWAISPLLKKPERTRTIRI